MHKDIRKDLAKLSSDLKKLVKMLSDAESKRALDAVRKLRESDGKNNK